MLKWLQNLRSEYFSFISLNFVILTELCNFWWIMRKVAIWGQLCKIATLQNIRSPVIMTLFPFYKSMMQFSGWSCSCGTLLAKFQPGVLNLFVFTCGCLLYLSILSLQVSLNQTQNWSCFVLSLTNPINKMFVTLIHLFWVSK